LCEDWISENNNLFAEEPEGLEEVVEKLGEEFKMLHFTG